MTDPARCVVVLSEKSSGSSACQNLLARFADVRHVAHTRHHQHETLYWTKAASVLGLPQIDMVDSEVPIPAARARADLERLLRANAAWEGGGPRDEADVIEGWRRLCLAHAPVFLEKSPHHLCQWSALELMLEAAGRLTDVRFHFVGLVRNPMDTLYSQFSRWRSRPEQVQHQWATAYRNLERFAPLAGDRLTIVRYEDMVADLAVLEPVFRFCGATGTGADDAYLHRRSVSRWRADRGFGFVLDDGVAEVAARFGYGASDLANEPRASWPVSRELRRAAYRAAAPVKALGRRVLRRR